MVVEQSILTLLTTSDSTPSPKENQYILYEYLHNAKSPEAIAQLFPTVTLEQVYATILYYLQNPVAIGQYVSDWLDHTSKAEAEQDTHPDPKIQRLKEIKATRPLAQWKFATC